jgi:hypothetical protein
MHSDGAADAGVSLSAPRWMQGEKHATICWTRSTRSQYKSDRLALSARTCRHAEQNAVPQLAKLLVVVVCCEGRIGTTISFQVKTPSEKPRYNCCGDQMRSSASNDRRAGLRVYRGLKRRIHLLVELASELTSRSILGLPRRRDAASTPSFWRIGQFSGDLHFLRELNWSRLGSFPRHRLW